MKNYPSMRAWRVPVPCSHDTCPAVHLVHYKHADNIKARGWTCRDHEPPSPDPELTHRPGCKGGGSTSRQPDGSTRHHCFGCGAADTRPPRDRDGRGGARS